MNQPASPTSEPPADEIGVLTRKGFLATAGIGLAAFVAGCGGSGSSTGGATVAATIGATSTSGPRQGLTAPFFVKGGELNVYSWPNFFDPKDGDVWKQRTGAKLNIGTYVTNDELFAKLNSSGGGGYDIVIPTNGWIPVMGQRGMLQKLDPEKIAWQNVDPRFLGLAFDPNNEYSVPKVVGTSGILYDPQAVGGELVTWQDVFDASAKSGVSGKVSTSSTPLDFIGKGVFANGDSIQSKDLAVWMRGADLVQEAWAPHIGAWDGAFDLDSILSGKILIMSTNPAIARAAMLKNKNLKWVLPKPKAELWVDTYAIPAQAPNPEAAYSFMSFLMQPKVQVAETEFHGYATARPGLAKALTADHWKLIDVTLPPDGVMDRLESVIVRPELQGDLEKRMSQIKASVA